MARAFFSSAKMMHHLLFSSISCSLVLADSAVVLAHSCRSCRSCRSFSPFVSLSFFCVQSMPDGYFTVSSLRRFFFSSTLHLFVFLFLHHRRSFCLSSLCIILLMLSFDDAASTVFPLPHKCFWLEKLPRVLILFHSLFICARFIFANAPAAGQTPNGSFGRHSQTLK